ncbi:hypothetical protein [Pseudalkalibacillus decolorationis]|uniref:hypothetical protein n=1 Tax=Pseudalkalibacillus decolorationis TaxID=163879 RepID=UPI002149432B|nr:hypothetical protein [Pseudalkalibacillus decolorationis]
MKKFAFIVFDNCAVWQVTLLQKFLKDKGWKIDTLSVDGSNISTDGGWLFMLNSPLKRLVLMVIFLFNMHERSFFNY